MSGNSKIYSTIPIDLLLEIINLRVNPEVDYHSIIFRILYLEDIHYLKGCAVVEEAPRRFEGEESRRFGPGLQAGD